MTNTAANNSHQSPHTYHQSPRPGPDSSISHGAQNSNQPGQQPVEFNHAINYVNKIKVRFDYSMGSLFVYLGLVLLCTKNVTITSVLSYMASLPTQELS